MTTEEILRGTEECQCLNCGFPMYVGDTVFIVDDDPFCSKRCAREMHNG